MMYRTRRRKLLEGALGLGAAASSFVSGCRGYLDSRYGAIRPGDAQPTAGQDYDDTDMAGLRVGCTLPSGLNVEAGVDYSQSGSDEDIEGVRTTADNTDLDIEARASFPIFTSGAVSINLSTAVGTKHTESKRTVTGREFDVDDTVVSNTDYTAVGVDASVNLGKTRLGAGIEKVSFTNSDNLTGFMRFWASAGVSF